MQFSWSSAIFCRKKSIHHGFRRPGMRHGVPTKTVLYTSAWNTDVWLQYAAVVSHVPPGPWFWLGRELCVPSPTTIVVLHRLRGFCGLQHQHRSRTIQFRLWHHDSRKCNIGLLLVPLHYSYYEHPWTHKPADEIRQLKDNTKHFLRLGLAFILQSSTPKTAPKPCLKLMPCLHHLTKNNILGVSVLDGPLSGMKVW